MYQDIFRLAVHRSLSKSQNPREVNNSTSYISLETSALETSKEKIEKEKEKQRVEAMTRSDFTELQVQKPFRGKINKNNGTNLEVFSKNLTETLLRGAVDLQVSLDMLESFQKNVNRRQKRHGEGGVGEGWFVEDLNANRYISNGASSRHNIEGLKKVISESLYKQNLITASSDDDKSSLNSSFRGNSNYSNSPGIVAKLMGLKEPPGNIENFQPAKGSTKEKSLNSLRAVFDLERMPRVKKEKLPEVRIDPNRRALLDIMETMQYKGLMRNKQGDREATTTSIREDQNARSVRQENGKMAYGKKVAKWEMRTFEEDKIETSKIADINNAKGKGIERRHAVSAKKNEKKGVNSLTSKSVQKSERKVARTSYGASASRVTKSMSHNSTPPTKEKKSVLPMRNESSRMLVDRKIKREGKGFNSKVQKNGGPANTHARHLESNYKPKRADRAPSVKDDWTKRGALYEALPDTKKFTKSRHSSIEEKEGKELIDLSQRAETDITILLLGNKSFTAFAKDDIRLCLDTAMEQVSRRNLKYSFFYPPYHVGTLGRRPYFSIEKLISEITHGIRKLNDYQSEKKIDALKDGLYLKLERDLECSDLGINSIWDCGWLDWICVEEASNVVCDFTDFVLSFLIEEISLDLFTFKF
ncbi:uncharacterized protein LOC144568802 [Carex rostrata]